MPTALVAILGALACSGEPAHPDVIPIGDYRYASDWLDNQLDQLEGDDSVPAVAVALIDDQDVVYERVSGTLDVGDGTAVDADTVWRVGSVTKLFTALAALRLAEDGLLDLDAPVTDVLPEFQVQSRFPDGDPITLRSLLAHRAGIPRNSGLPEWYWEISDDPLAPQSEALATQQVAHPAGERFHYSNVGYCVIAQVTEEVVGTSWLEYVHDEILDPIGMVDSALVWNLLPEDAEVATGYAGEEGALEAYLQYDVIWVPASNLFAPLADLETFASWVFRDGEGVLDSETLWQSFEPQYDRPRDPEEHGLGWFTSRRRFDEPIVFHTGTMHGTSTMVALLPESRLGVVLVGTSELFAQPANDLAVEALSLMLETRGDSVPESEDPAGVDLDRDELDRYVGVWTPGGEPAEVYRSGGRLKVHYQGVDLRLDPVGDDRFLLEHWLVDPGDITVSFQFGEGGEQDLVIIDLGRMDYTIGPRYDAAALPEQWTDLVGRYQQRPRLESEYFQPTPIWTSQVTLTDEGVLMLPGMPLWPISDSELLVVGGQWDGETVLYDPDLRRLSHGSNTWTWKGPLDDDCGCSSVDGRSQVGGLTLICTLGWCVRRRRLGRSADLAGRTGCHTGGGAGDSSG